LFHGHLPPNPEEIAFGMVRAIAPMFSDVSAEQLESFRSELLVALERQVAFERWDAEITGGWIQ